MSIIPAEDDEDGYESVEGEEQAEAGKSKRWNEPLWNSTSGPLIEGGSQKRGLPVVVWHDQEAVCGSDVMDGSLTDVVKRCVGSKG